MPQNLHVSSFNKSYCFHFCAIHLPIAQSQEKVNNRSLDACRRLGGSRVAFAHEPSTSTGSRVSRGCRRRARHVQGDTRATCGECKKYCPQASLPTETQTVSCDRRRSRRAGGVEREHALQTARNHRQRNVKLLRIWLSWSGTHRCCTSGAFQRRQDARCNTPHVVHSHQSQQNITTAHSWLYEACEFASSAADSSQGGVFESRRQHQGQSGCRNHSARAGERRAQAGRSDYGRHCWEHWHQPCHDGPSSRLQMLHCYA